MKQKAVVLELKGKNALVSVRRSSMCEGCEKQGGCGSSCAAGDLLGAAKTMTVLADNDVGAKAGDLVEVESESKTVLGYAALVFLFPIVLCALFYGAASLFGGGETASSVSAVIGFLASFPVILVVDRIKKKKSRPDIRITRIL